MLDRQTTILWAQELLSFANNNAQATVFTEAGAEGEQLRPPEEPRPNAQTAALRDAATKRLRLLVKLVPTKRGGKLDKKLRRAATEWLDHPLVRSTHGYNLTPADVGFSLSPDGRLQLTTPHFRSRDARFAVAFAELIGPEPVAVVRRCPWNDGDTKAKCDNFFINPLGVRQRPCIYCPEHRSDAPINRRARLRKHRKNPVRFNKRRNRGAVP